ncbi:MAG: hypothetical protein Q9185_000808 [Variospora sp. 1 TL-2023]
MAPPSIRPRNKGGTSTAKDYADSNSTSAKFLGGPQKSWMSGQKGSAIRTCPKPTMLASGPQQEPAGDQQVHSTFVSQLNTFPRLRQSPLDGQSPPETTIPPGGVDDSLRIVPTNHQNCANVESVLPSPAPSDEHRPDVFRNLEPEVEVRTNGAATRYGEVNGRNNRLPSSEPAISPPSLNQTVPYIGQVSVGSHIFTGVNQISGQGAMLGKRKRLAHEATVDTATAMLSGTAPNIGDVESRHICKQPTDVQMRSFVGAIVSRQQSLASQGTGGRGTELARLYLLRTACTENDHHYLLLHQLYCWYPRSYDASPQLRAVGFCSDHFKGLEILALLMPNHPELAEDAVDWFANFPLPFQRLIHDYRIYREILENAMSCLIKLACGWGRLLDDCAKRGFPPFVDELVLTLGVQSPILQSVMFRSIHRHIWIGGMNDSCFQEGERLFYEDQHRMQQMPASVANVDKQTENQRLIINYQRMQAAHRSHLQGTAIDSQTRASPVSIAPMPPPPPYVHGRFYDIQRANCSNAPSNQGGNNPPVTLTNQRMQNVVARSTNTASPTVPSQPFILPRDSRLALHGRSGALPASPRAVSHPELGHFFQAQSFGPSRSPTAIPSPGGVSRQQGQFLPGSPTGSRPPHQDHQIHPLQLSRGSSTARPWGPATAMQPGHLTAHNHFVSPVTPGANALARPTPLVPQNGEILRTAAQANPMATAIHQYQARSPILKAMDQSDLRTSGTQYYRYMKGVTVIDTRLKTGSRQHLEWALNIDEAVLRLLGGTVDPQNGSLPIRRVQVGSAFCQVRCVDATESRGGISDGDWMVARHVWPSHVSVIFNGKPLDIRKKIHHGRDLPVEITSLIQRGNNTLSVSILRGSKEDNVEYAIGVESIRLLDFKTAKDLTGVLPYGEARQRILERLQNNDPEIEVVDTSITLNLTDPYTSQIWDIPMRGKTCRHPQCFDLDTFLRTRISRRPGQPCDSDQFKCPICDADARPPSLVRDEFFLSLRAILASMDRLDAKAIVMQQDGSWRIKEEEKSGETGDGSGRLSTGSRPGAATAGVNGADARREIETIELDDD